jgi:hypothetical protein
MGILPNIVQITLETLFGELIQHLQIIHNENDKLDHSPQIRIPEIQLPLTRIGPDQKQETLLKVNMQPF